MQALDPTDWITQAEAATERIRRGAADECAGHFERGDIWNTVAEAAGPDVAAEIAAELEVHPGVFLQERHIARAWPASTRVYASLTWSHYRATAYMDDADRAADLMAEAEVNGWPVEKLAKEVKAARAGKPSPDDAPMPDPDAYDSAAGYCVAMLVRDGMAERKAARLVGDVFRWAEEWDGGAMIDDVFGPAGMPAEIEDVTP